MSENLNIPQITWIRLNTGFAIENMQQKHHGKVVNMLLNDYITQDEICKLVDLENAQKSVDSFIKHAKYLMDKNCSIVAIDDNKNEIAGALIMCPVSKLEFGRIYAHERENQGETYNNLINYETELQRNVDMFVKYNCLEFMRFHILVINNEYRSKFLEYTLLRAGVEIARHFQVIVGSIAVGANKMRQFAERVGFETIFSSILDNGNEYALMVINIPPIVIENEISCLKICKS